ncbi:hypothetical protein DVH24_008761 [Malus domestica]|uniref:Alpha-1,2-Mannosidase n=1 Tax=Malus domestica TaxID=3750 RepID=A0A498JN03_MALDO|nr:hypothetical protein DVH24_008761 [Malus domestica]
MENETTETSTSGCGSLILGMGALSRLIGDPKYESAALCALRELWGMWSSLNLLGTTLDISTGEWIVYSSGIGAGPWYIEVGQSILNSLNLYTKVERGFANIRDVTTMQLEDHQHSFFLAET